MRRYSLIVRDSRGKRYVVDERASKNTVFRDGEDILANGLVMNGYRIDVDEVHIKRVR